jgi:DNA-binding PadR family transcriptional regulator
MESSSSEPRNFLPLTPIVFHMLLALSNEDLHGYAIIKEVKSSTDGRVNIQTGTLYQAIKRLLDVGLIQSVESKIDPKLDDERRRYYSLSDLGMKILSEEASRLEGMVKLARSKNILGPEKAGIGMVIS